MLYGASIGPETCSLALKGTIQRQGPFASMKENV